MKKTILALGIALLISGITVQKINAQASTTIVGTEMMYPAKDIVTNAVKSKDHTTLVAAVKAAGLVETLSGKGPFTVFAPVNNAFEDLPEGTVSTLLMAENKKMLTGVLTYHVLAGTYSFKDIASAIKSKNGKVSMKTVNGQQLTFSMNGEHNIIITDSSGAIANISTYDVMQSNGVIHVIDKVLLPEM
jgi:uncharacterized surface protein with fasciclin (FAS1) repeats